MGQTLEHLETTFAAQRTAVLNDPLPSLAKRLDRIGRIRQMLTDGQDRVRVAMQSDFGALHPSMVAMLDTFPVIDRVNHFEANLQAWLQPTSVPLGDEHGSSTAEVIRVPTGVNGNIAPWNFPIESALVMTVDMLAAGNTVMIKPSELAPATSQLLADLVANYFEPTEMSIVLGGVDIAQAFSEMPWDHLTYTGSGRVGRLVAAAAAKNLVPVTLELGGKNPTLFAPDGVTAELVERFMAFRLLKAGQICTSPDYALVPHGQLDAWVALVERMWARTYPDGLVGHPDATGIINAQHFQRLSGYLDEARDRGIAVVTLGDEEADEDLRQIPVTLVIDPPDDLACMTEEVFGPIIPVVGYDTIDAAIARINAGPSPLGAYLASRDTELAARFTVAVRSGGTGINTFGLQGGNAALPFGGFGASGHGCHSGFDGFCNYSHTKSVFHGADDSFVHQVIAPPYERGEA